MFYFVFCFFIFFVKYFSQGIDLDIPQNIIAGNTYTVQVKIQRNSLSTSFSKYYLDLSEGLTVKEHQSLNGSFAFESTQKRAKIIWSETPAETLLKFSIIIEVSPNAPDEGYLCQKYSFIDGEQKKEISALPKKIKILHSSPPSQIALAHVNLPQKENEIPNENNRVFQKINSNQTNTFNQAEPQKVSDNQQKSEFKIQVLATSKKPSNLTKYQRWGKTTIYEENGMFKVMLGSFSSKDEAGKKLLELKESGIDGFIVYFENGIKK